MPEKLQEQSLNFQQRQTWQRFDTSFEGGVFWEV